MAKEVTTGDWERNYREKHLSFLWKRQRRRALSESALHTDLVSRGAPFTDLQISLLFFKARKDSNDYLHGTGCEIQPNSHIRNSCSLQLKQARTMNSC